jgi:hypothetical protein
LHSLVDTQTLQRALYRVNGYSHKRQKMLGGWSAPFALWVFDNWAELSRKVDGARIAAEVRANLLSHGKRKPRPVPEQAEGVHCHRCHRIVAEWCRGDSCPGEWV